MESGGGREASQVEEVGQTQGGHSMIAALRCSHLNMS